MEVTATQQEPLAKEKPKALARGDKHIWGIIIALCIVSIVELYSASSREVAASAMGVMGPILRHLAMLCGGLGLLWYFSRKHYSYFAGFSICFAIASALMMGYVMFFGAEINGARRSLSFLGFGIFPAEFIKLSAVLMTALIMTLNQDPKGVGITKKGMLWCGALMLFFCGLLATQGLTNALLLVSITYAMMVIGGVKFMHLINFSLTLAVVGAVFFGTLYYVDIYLPDKAMEEAKQTGNVEMIKKLEEEGQKSRIRTWIARIDRHGNDSVAKWELPATGDNRQEVLGYMAQAHGGVTGVGPGNSREAARLPLAFSDYIYAIVIEELGLIGGIAVLMLYLWLLGRAASIGSRCTVTYPALLVMGMAVFLSFQALCHMGIVSGVFPVSGQPLPLISKGGTSIVVTSIAFAIMLSVSRTATGKANKKQEIRDELDSLPEQLRDQNKMQL